MREKLSVLRKLLFHFNYFILHCQLNWSFENKSFPFFNLGLCAVWFGEYFRLIDWKLIEGKNRFHEDFRSRALLQMFPVQDFCNHVLKIWIKNTPFSKILLLRLSSQQQKVVFQTNWIILLNQFSKAKSSWKCHKKSFFLLTLSFLQGRK